MGRCNATFTLAFVGTSIAGLLHGQALHAQDNVSIVVPKAVGTGGKSIGAFGYKPDTDGAGPDTEAIYVTSYGFNAATPGNPTIMRVTGIGAGQTPTGTVMVSEAQMRFFYGNGTPDFSVSGNQGGSSFLLNPVTIGSGPAAIQPYTRAWTIEGVTVRDAASNNLPAISDRYVRYSLGQVADNADTANHLTTLADWSDFQAAIDAENGASPAPTAAFVPIRQGAWSRDGQWQYQSDSSAAYGGIWRLDPVNAGNVTRIVSAPRAATITEIAVVAPPAGSSDRILFLAKSGDAN